ncbi:glyceraldehyde 3-phosphate dehydrogenase NAD-binding domain-containing protein [Thermodesulfobacteriota bacterium]
MGTLSKKGAGSDLKLGINGLGRIGKLAVWDQVSRKYFSELVINLGRQAGSSLEDIADYIEKDSTYGSLGTYLYGYSSGRVIDDLDENSGTMRIDGVKVRILQQNRNPKNIQWMENDVRLVVDATGHFLDPSISPDEPGGAVKGHLEAGAEKVIVSAPFKIKDKSIPMPPEAVTTVMGINEDDYDPRLHTIVSNASCTTTCLAHMMKPLLNHFGPQKILTASMATIHATTGSQSVLDKIPKAGAKDLRKSRSIFNNIILTTTGAAKTLSLVIPEMKQIGFIAESVRIPTSTGSLIILVVNLLEEPTSDSIRRNVINNIYDQTAKRDPQGYLRYSSGQNVSSDIIGFPKAAAIIEGNETHTRTAEVEIDLKKACRFDDTHLPDKNGKSEVTIAITQAVIYGWYDNEMGGYVRMLGDRIISIAEMM